MAFLYVILIQQFYNKTAKKFFLSFKTDMNNINFKAVHIANPKIQVLNKKGEYEDKVVTIAKRNPYSQLDYNSLLDIAALWGDVKPNYVQSMLHHSDIIKDDEKRDVYFLTEQTENLRKILPEKVLGVVEVTKHKEFSKINFIQTKPDCAYASDTRTYKKVGWKMLEMVESLYGKHKIYLNAVRKAIPFYLKYGFKITYEKCTNPHMVLNRMH